MTVQPITTNYVPEWTLGDRLRKARRQTGMTQADFSKLIGVEASRYSQWEADNNRPRDMVDVAQVIEEQTGISAAWTLGLVPHSTDRRGLHRVNNQMNGLGRVAPKTHESSRGLRLLPPLPFAPAA